MKQKNNIKTVQPCGIHQSVHWPRNRKIPDVGDYDMAVDVCGDTMEPEYWPGDILLIKRCDMILPGRPYVLDTTDGTLIRYVTMDGDDYFCSSTDPAKYPSFTVPSRFINGTYRIVGLVRVFWAQ